MGNIFHENLIIKYDIVVKMNYAKKMKQLIEDSMQYKRKKRMIVMKRYVDKKQNNDKF